MTPGGELGAVPMSRPVTDLARVMDVSGQHVVVTGGGGGIGFGISRAFAQRGANVAVLDVDVKGGTAAIESLRQFGGDHLFVECDVSDRKAVQSSVDVVHATFGHIDVLVNNAGITWGAPTLEYPLDKWDKIFAVNVRGVWVLSQKVANIMKDQGGGKMINISSIFGSRGSIEEGHPAVAYNPSKAAVEVLTKNLAVKLARYQIRVNCIAPGFFRTDMMEYIFKPEMKGILDIMLGQIPLRMYGEADHIKGLAVYLASPASDFVTGAIIPVDGGLGAM